MQLYAVAIQQIRRRDVAGRKASSQRKRNAGRSDQLQYTETAIVCRTLRFEKQGKVDHGYEAQVVTSAVCVGSKRPELGPEQKLKHRRSKFRLLLLSEQRKVRSDASCHAEAA